MGKCLMNNPLDKLSQEEPIECDQSSTSLKWWSDCKINSRELFEMVDREIHYEHNLISHRMTWYVTSQSFLMAAFAVSGGYNHRFVWLAKPLIPILGVVTSLIIWFSLIAAIEAMRRLKVYKNEIFRQDNYLQNLNPFNLRFRKEKEKENWFKFMIRVGWIHYIGLSPPVVIPLIFLIAWIIALVQVYK
jgi:hypothetical protein